MRKIVRESKFRHCYGKPSPKDQIFDGFTASNTRLDGNICTANRKYIAIVLSSQGGGIFTVLNRNKPGRQDRVFRFIGHTSEIVDVTFDRFNSNRIVSGADDGSFIVWWVPEGGMVNDISDYQCSLKASQKRVVQSEWHPTACDILIGINIDSINIFNVSKAECIRSIETSPTSDQMLFGFSLNFNGSAAAASFKDRKVRVFDLMTGEKKHEFSTHEGTKPIKVAWMGRDKEEDLLVTTGATKMSERQISVWKIADEPNEALHVENLDSASASLNIVYDFDTKLIVLFGKGESSIKFFEFDMEPEPKLYNVSNFTSQEAHRAVGFGNKLSCNYNNNEILHAVRVLSKGVEEVCFLVPRRSDQFQSDLYPDTNSETPAMSAADFESGKVTEPNVVNLNGYIFPDGTSPILTKTNMGTLHRRSTENKASISHNTSIYSPIDYSTEISELKTALSDILVRVEHLEEMQK